MFVIRIWEKLDDGILDHATNDSFVFEQQRMFPLEVGQYELFCSAPTFDCWQKETPRLLLENSKFVVEELQVSIIVKKKISHIISSFVSISDIPLHIY